MQMKKLPRKNSSREESFSQANSTLFFFHQQLHYTYRNILTKRIDRCNSAVSALKGCIGAGWLDVTAEAFEEIETFGFGTPAEFGQYTGVVVNIVTKSGSNSFHGALSYYGQF
jgi:hypothetical protein